MDPLSCRERGVEHGSLRRHGCPDLLPNQFQLLLSSPPLSVLVDESSAAARVFVHGIGREGLMLRAFCLHLHHLGLSAHIVGDVTTPSIASGDLLIASAGTDGFTTVDAIYRVTKTASARHCESSVYERGVLDCGCDCPSTGINNGCWSGGWCCG